MVSYVCVRQFLCLYQSLVECKLFCLPHPACICTWTEPWHCIKSQRKVQAHSSLRTSSMEIGSYGNEVSITHLAIEPFVVALSPTPFAVHVCACPAAWWRERLSHMAQYFQAYRIDHILGFFRIWEIPGDCSTGLLGHFRPSLPLWRSELEGRGLWDLERLVQPYVRCM